MKKSEIIYLKDLIKSLQDQKTTIDSLTYTSDYKSGFKNAIDISIELFSTMLKENEE